jgi:hypothetical protein
MFQWSAQLPLSPLPLTSVDVQMALAAQDSIGWDNFFEGRLA